MSVIFNPETEGSVVALSIGRATTGAIQIENLEAQNLVIASFGISRQANVQIAPSLRNSVFIYSFGERIGEMRIAGVAFHRLCDGQTFGSQQSFAGLTEASEFYDEYGLGSAEKLAPVFISLGSISIRGYLVGMEVSSVDAEANLMGFSYSFVVVPNKIGTRGGPRR